MVKPQNQRKGSGSDKGLQGWGDRSGSEGLNRDAESEGDGALLRITRKGLEGAEDEPLFSGGWLLTNYLWRAMS